MTTEVKKTLDVGSMVVEEESRVETLIPESVSSATQVEDNGVDNSHVAADGNGVLRMVTQTTVETSLQAEEKVGLTSLAMAETETETNNDLDEESEKIGDFEKLDIDLNGEEDEQGNKDDVYSSCGEEKEVYQIGDLVWGKIKSHPWWPGQIYDPSNASDYAKKQRSSGHLVAYFGDGSFSWCSPSQLRHIDEDFNEKSLQSNAKNFSTAIEKALNEITRLVKLKMTCSCIPIEPNQQFVENAGIKSGVLMTNHDITLLSTVGFESSELLADIKSIAKISSSKNRLEIATITGWLSAYNRTTTGTHELATYNGPFYIDGMEDKKKKTVKKVVLSHLNIPDEIMNEDEEEEEFPSLKKKEVENSIDLHQRKKKSVADLLKESKTVDAIDYPTAKKIKSGKKSESSHPKRSKLKTIETNNSEKDEENMEIVHTPRERKRSKYLSPPYTNPNVFFSKHDFKSDSIESITSSSESISKTSSPATSDSSFMIESHESPKEVLSVLKSAASDPLDLRRKNPLGSTKGFLRSFREAYYLNGSTYKEYHQNQSGKKRNLDTPRTNNHGKKKLKPCEEEIAKPTLLMASFPPGFSLPSKDKIIGLFSKFGLLDEKLTDVSYNSYCARIAFINASDAEQTFKICSDGESPNPFGETADAGKIKYRLEFATGENTFVFIKKKLEKMTMMMEKCHGSMPEEMKKKLMDEMNDLLEKVNEIMTES